MSDKRIDKGNETCAPCHLKQWVRVQSLFADALDLPVSQRDDFLRRIHDQPTRDEVASLLDAYALAERAFEVSPIHLLHERLTKNPPAE